MSRTFDARNRKYGARASSATLGAPGTNPRLFRDDRIADADGAPGDHLRIDTAVGVPEASHQRLRNVEVARRRLRIDVDRRAADDSLDDPEPRVADSNGPVEQLEFVPGRPAADIEIGAETQRMDRQANHILDRKA